MQPRYTKNSVAENKRIYGNIYRLIIEGNFEVSPGQFYNLRAWGKEPILSRPISINDVAEGTITFLYEIRGEGTRILGNLKPGDIVELLGPLGSGFEVDKIKGRVGIVTGGIGIAPMLYTARKLKADKIDLIAGFRDESYLLDEFEKYVNKIYVATDSGTEGHKGFVTDLLNPQDYDVVLGCGPEIMMSKIVKKCNEAGTMVYISMESHMACGIGACLVCACKTVDGMKRTCKDGPVFSGRDVIING